MGSLDGESIMVTGASRGLGREMSLAFSREGANVALLSRSADELEDVAAAAPGEAIPIPTDVSDGEQVAEAVHQTVETFGTIDTVVNNAAVGLLSLSQELKKVHEVSEAEWDVILETNLKGTFLLIRETLPHMLENGRGNVINISSGQGRTPVEYGGSAWSPYTVSKHGVEALSVIVHLEYGDDGVNSNCLDPGGRVDTGFWSHLPDDEREHIFSADHMNEAAFLLAEQSANGVSGESMNADEWEERLGGS
jgi:3-oxoacyl-[acyl-carrier protein] reductase